MHNGHKNCDFYSDYCMNNIGFCWHACEAQKATDALKSLETPCKYGVKSAWTLFKTNHWSAHYTNSTNGRHLEGMRMRLRSQVREQKLLKWRLLHWFLRFSCLGKHGAALVGLPNLLEEHEILQRDDKHECKSLLLRGFERSAEPHNQEAGPQQDGLHLHVHVQRELDAEVVGIGEDLLQEAAPLLADAPDRLVAVFGLQLQGNKITR